MTATIENIVGLKSAIEHAKSLKPYSNMGISASLVVDIGDTLAAQAKEIEQLKAQIERLQKQKKELLLGFDEYKQMQNVADAEIKAQAVDALKFPTMFRKMWSGSEVQAWIKEEAKLIRQQAKGE